MPLFQIVLEILCDTLMQMYALMSSHIVRLTRVHEEVGLRTGLYAGFEE